MATGLEDKSRKLQAGATVTACPGKAYAISSQCAHNVCSSTFAYKHVKSFAGVFNTAQSVEGSLQIRRGARYLLAFKQ